MAFPVDRINVAVTATERKQLANCLRVLSFDAVEQANSGHPGMPMGMADAAAVLFADFLKFDATMPDWPDRDRFVLSNGHGSMLLYSLLHLTGYPQMTMEQLRNFRQLGSLTPGHPEYGETPGVEITTGPLGQGLAAAVGMAIAEKLLASQFGEELVDHRTWVFVGDGCLMEGVGQEAVSLAGHLGLSKLVVVFDDNEITIDGAIDLSRSEDVPAKFKATGWRVLAADGHDHVSIRQAFAAACEPTNQPVLVDLKTVIGYGAPGKQGSAGVHGSPLGAEQQEAARKELGWTEQPFVIPATLREQWLAIGKRGQQPRKEWEERLVTCAPKQGDEFCRRMDRQLPTGFNSKVRAFANRLVAEPAEISTRKAGQEALEFLVAELPEMVGGSADLTGSNLTKVTGMEPFRADAPGRYIHYGVREFAMCAAVNGISLHGGFIAYGGTFLVFTDYARNALRLAAMMGVRAVFVMTHDSIGLGEDGPTHQPVEHLASLRAVPGLQVMRPADRVETFECWELALTGASVPTVLSLTRQGVPQLRNTGNPKNSCANGAYVLKEAQGKRRATLLATGSEVQLALTAAQQLEGDGLPTAVVSMPCWELFEGQEKAYRNKVLGTAPRLAVEAASKFGWTRYVACEDDVIGMDGFGVSAPATQAYAHFGITAEALVARARQLIKQGN